MSPQVSSDVILPMGYGTGIWNAKQICDKIENEYLPEDKFIVTI